MSATTKPVGFNAGGIVVQSYEPPGLNVTVASNLLSIEFQAALSETLGTRAWDDGVGSDDLASDPLRLFADQIDASANALALGASAVLAELELNTLPPTNHYFQSIYGAALLEEFSQFDESLFLRPTDGASWLEVLQSEVSVVESWEIEAEKLTEIALAAFHNLKNGSADIAANATREASSTLATTADGLYQEKQLQHEWWKQAQMMANLKQVDPTLLEDETWVSGGFRIDDTVRPDMALEAIQALSLKRYKLKDDTDLGVRKSERRTRHHVGVVDAGNETGALDPASIFSLNIGAVSQLATSLDLLASKVAASTTFSRHSLLEEKVSQMRAQTEAQSHGSSYKSPSQLASEVAALETEAALTRIARLSQAVVQSTRINLMHSKLASRSKLDGLNGQSSERVAMVERESASARETHAEDSEAYVDQLLIHLDTIGKMRTAWNSTKRELLEMEEDANIESHVAKEEVHAEATVERENEAASLDRIKLVGKARVDEVLHSIENVFWHLAGCLQHVVTPEGRRQFLFYIGSAALLVFAASTIKEMIALICLCILRFFTAPRLVREYGNLSTRPKWAKNNASEKDIVLPADIKERMDVIVKVASAASRRRFPLRSVLIHGKPGSGKSLVAKTIATSIPELPHALMSGADVFPMGRQGPAELRRLLTWASSKRHGGVIIIDEAESMLASRSKRSTKEESNKTLGSESAASSPGFARDCLNTLLSMTGSFGNIMLILTTSNPSDLDEAVLDRMDEIIHLPLPEAEERRTLLRNEFNRQFEETKQDAQPALLSQLTTRIRKRRGARACFAHKFDAEGCITDLASDAKTGGFSGRELEKIMNGVRHKTYGTDTGVLCAELWKRETETLLASIAAKHLLKK
ncbi:hypothetical protein ACHAXT_006451 [Thalassiosira profunda]